MVKNHYGDIMARPQKYTQTQVIDSASLLFKTQGYRATSIDQLLQATNLSRSSLYSGFGNKEALYLTVIDQVANQSACLFFDVMQSSSPEEFIRAFFRSYFADNSAHEPGIGCLLVNTVVELADTEPELVKHAMKYLILVEQSLTAYFKQAQQAGQLNNQHDPAALAKFFMHIKKGLMVSVRHGTPLDELSDVIETSLCILKAPSLTK